LFFCPSGERLNIRFFAHYLPACGSPARHSRVFDNPQTRQIQSNTRRTGEWTKSSIAVQKCGQNATCGVGGLDLCAVGAGCSYSKPGKTDRQARSWNTRRQADVLESNGTYTAPKPESFRKWAREVPDGFVFSVKAALATIAGAGGGGRFSLSGFTNSVVPGLGDRLGPVCGNSADQEIRLRHFADSSSLLPRTARGRAPAHVVEVRHPFLRARFHALLRNSQRRWCSPNTQHPTLHRIRDRLFSFYAAAAEWQMTKSYLLSLRRAGILGRRGAASDVGRRWEPDTGRASSGVAKTRRANVFAL